MQKVCDLYIPEASNNDCLRLLHVFDKKFIYKNTCKYFGYLQTNISRLKLVSIVVELRKKGIQSFNVPIDYRNNKNLTIDEALLFANKYADSNGIKIGRSFKNSQIYLPPVFWYFTALYDENGGDEMVGSSVKVDCLDGHIWGDEEYREYMYDYNNVL